LVVLGLAVVLPNSAIGLLDLAIGFAGSICRFFVGFWPLLLLDWIPGVLDFCWSFVWFGFD